MIELEIGSVDIAAIDGEDFLGYKVAGLGQNPGTTFHEAYHLYGFYSRAPAKDATGRGCNAFYWYEGDEGFCLLLSDPRAMSKPPNLRDGETCMYGPKGQFARMHEDGSISLACTEDATIDGRSIFLRLSPTVTEESGRTRGGFELVTPWGNITFGATGFHVTHSSGARLDLGAIGGLPAPLDVITSYAKIKAGVITQQASAVAQGTDGGATHAAAVTALTTWMLAVAAVIDAKLAPTTTVTPLTAAAVTAVTNLGAVV